ncbi:hypothetical protein LOTGIDRAFT_159952 [Lottia gigantea]|uniref:Fucolectin tachylectin-4 pentraxin-1 domain-containing protein n=1 Tax=Lottia gigantea TaxID=225164 RepID=V4AI00_LOTGI|nr:hypothetical protein LOTGIDRAFT_159952 [Lottia gigantea]ESO96537.1 hypothetical protein LOTGIDRAFT_159952 [Lottia gigantea]
MKLTVVWGQDNCGFETNSSMEFRNNSEGGRRNLALNKPATHISQYSDLAARRANDGIDGIDSSLGSCSHTAGYAAPVPESHPWWEVDLLQEYYISAVAISHPSYDPPRLCHDFSIKIHRDGETIDDAVFCYYHVGQPTKDATELYWCKTAIQGRHNMAFFFLC